MLKYLRCYCSKIPELRNLSIFLRGLIIVSSYTFQNHWSRGKRQKSKRTMTSFELLNLARHCTYLALEIKIL